nr:piscidin [Epinephelus coioides]
MKFVMVFLVLSLVVLMAEPGEGFLRHIKSFWKGAKAIFRGARQGWREHRALSKQRKMDQGGGGNEVDNGTPPYWQK